MAKYAMIYFVLGMALAAYLDAGARALLRERTLWFALAIAALVILPNIFWNLEHGLATFRHTGDNIHGSGLAFSPAKGFEFVAAQFFVFGPVTCTVLLLALARIAAPEITRADRSMLAFAIPPLALVTAVAFITRALANWAAPAFISAVIVAVAILIRRGAWNWLAASLGIGLLTEAALLVGDATATRLNVPWLANGDVYHRTLGWRALGESAGELARRSGARTIAGDARDDEASLLYYWRDQPERVLAWRQGAVPDHQFDLTRALTDEAPLPLLFVSHCGNSNRLARQFAQVEPLGTFDAPTGPTSARTYFAFKLDGKRSRLAPLGGCGEP